MLANCLTMSELADYNKHHAANNYIDPLRQIFCVRFNNAPEIGDYWIEKKERESTDIEDFRSSAFRSALEGQREVTASTDTTFYQLGDKMKSKLKISDG